tara:strand:- start:450 stop:1220 length:771 start_codon:yes stop_codon:yes gene_type:complete
MNLLQIKNFIVAWINDYVENNHVDALIVGVSGGIDSALTSTLCAMTNVKTIAVSIPINQRKNELDNANQHINWLLKKYPNTTSEIIDLSKVFEQYKKTIPPQYKSDLGFANSKARIRMTTLYQIASNKNGLVVGTGNKIEDFGIGFFTKYGDGGVDISPIADLTKSEVQNLAAFCGVKRDIIQAPPTDGLWEDGRNDEEQIGATYKELEWAMDFNQKIKLTTREKKVLDIYRKLNEKNQHKMHAVPVCKIPEKMRS